MNAQIAWVLVQKRDSTRRRTSKTQSDLVSMGFVRCDFVDQSLLRRLSLARNALHHLPS